MFVEDSTKFNQARGGRRGRGFKLFVIQASWRPERAWRFKRFRSSASGKIELKDANQVNLKNILETH